MINLFIENIQKHHINFEKHNYNKTDVSGFSRVVPCTIYPKNKDEIQKILTFANDYKIKIFPVSCGKNWGFGAELPIEDNSIIVNLKNYNNIVNLDLEFGYATITPGVTQQQLSDKLEDSNFYLDVTGASANSSIIGNALERGVAYNTLRVETISEFEIITPTGKTIHTGYKALNQSTDCHYPWGIGPALDGLFFQSNLGIITQAKIKLLKRPEEMNSFIITLKNQQDLLDFTDRLRPLLEDGTLDCIPHIFNKERLFPGLAPLIWQYFNNINKSKSKEEIEKILAKQFNGEWFAAGNLKGSKAKVKLITKELKKIVHSNNQLNFIGKKEKIIFKLINKMPWMDNLKAFIHATNELGNLTTGVPTNLTLPSVKWPVGNNFEHLFSLDIDNKGDGGFQYFTPMGPFDRKNILIMIDMAKNIGEEFNFKTATTLNAIRPDVMEGVISISYNKNNSEEIKRASNCINKMNQEMIKKGLFPYRNNINSMDIMTFKDDYKEILINLKNSFDPNNILAPGRYIPNIKSSKIEKIAA